MLTMDQLEKGFNLGEWEVLPQKGVLRRGDEEAHPEPKVLAVLLTLAQRDGDLVTKDELIEEVWEGRAFGDEPIQRCVALLRKHFGDTRPYEYIETLQRRGYRLLKPVELHEPADVLVAEPPESNGGDVRRWKIVTALIAAGFVAVAALTWVPDREPAMQSIAILPMDNLTGDPANQDITEGIQYSLAVRLSELPDFMIRNVRLVPDVPPAEVAEALNVEFVFRGSLQMQGEMLKITWQIDRGADNFNYISGEVPGDLRELFSLQEQLAQAVRAELAGPGTPQLVARYEPESAAYNSFTRGMYLLERRGEALNLEESIELFKESVSLDDNFGPAYLALAEAYALLPDYRNLPLDEYLQKAVTTVEAGINADSSIENAAASIYGFVLHQQKRWQESEKLHKRAINAAVVDANSFNWYSKMLSSVGRREDSVRVALAGEMVDPGNPIVSNPIALTYLWLGETQKAQEYFERAGKLGSGGRYQLLGHAMLYMRLERFEEAKELAIAEWKAQDLPSDWIEPVFAGFADPTQAETALDVLDQEWTPESLPPMVEFIARSWLGDVNGAMEIAQLLKEPGEAFEMDLLFIPETEPLRKHPDFMPLMQELGLVAYWGSVGCVWELSQVSC
jgi:DNA-binding winged helix-turn-helix (wHTH) protein/TolB-like protein